MVEKIYDTIRAIIYNEFPLNSAGQPVVYDRQIQEWFFGDRQIIPSPLGVIMRGTTSNIRDAGYGLREIEYTIGITFYSDGDDKETSERVVQESARILHSILKNHRTMYICDLCPFCDKFPLNPIHYIDNGVVTKVGINTAILPANSSFYTVRIDGDSNLGLAATSVIRLSNGISGKVTVAEILSSGVGINTTSYTDAYVDLSLTLSGGSTHTGYSTTLMNSYANNVSNQINTFWTETHTTSAPPYLDWSGVAYEAVSEFISDWSANIKPSSITSVATWTNNLNSIVANNVDLVRLLQDIQVGDITPSDDGMEKAFLHTAEFKLKAKEIISVDQFGPNNVNVNAI
jgi:hypothetical protein